MQEFNLPLYALRQFEDIVTEGEYTVVVSRFDKYILDSPSLEGDFRMRRLRLAVTPKGNLPYKLYPLKAQLTMLSHFARSKSKVFIDSNGNIFRRKKSRFFNIEVRRVVSGARLYNGKFQCFAKGVSTAITLDHIPKWVSLIRYKNSYILFDVHEEMPTSPRMRVKI